jgi:hypothetical protein
MSRRNRMFFVVGLVVALVLAGIVSFYASSSPDGLNKVAADHGIAATETGHGAKDSPLAGYSTRGVGNDRLSGAVAGVAGVALTLGLATGVFWVVRRRQPVTDAEPRSVDAGSRSE